MSTFNQRGAGILMHITSLPSAFGIGDFGPEAKIFADFLVRSYQKYWQLLPLNPPDSETANSPYSSISSLAGNPLLISPEQIVADGLLDSKDLSPWYLPPEDKVNYIEAKKIKDILFEKAYHNFCINKSSLLHQQFQRFCQKESHWLTDFSCYVVLKQQHDNKPWYQWPKDFKFRQQKVLDEFQHKNTAALDKVKWLQFIFAKQWNELKTYCNRNNIRIFGDLPLYVSYDSADVWSRPDIFYLDDEGNQEYVAGVPPDYFNANGQRWGMPVFRWDVLKTQHYDWWVQRIRKNMERYDILRLDHFRAFADYWEVPADEETAINGTWKPGPGPDLFITLQKQLGELPFVAEDLGDINDAVYELRDKFALPGMKVLQFAFSENMPQSDYIPHNYTANYVVYTGTHDNNTTCGWFVDLDKATRNRIRQYTGRPASKKNIHQVLGRMAYAAVANTVILPLQDVLGLDETARMNTPAATENNWLWRLQPALLSTTHEKHLKEWVIWYNRK